jgi:enoyl-CoA hydratase
MIRIETRGAVGIITLDRPEKLNTLTLPMVEDLHAALDGFRENDSVGTLVFRSDLDKAFCAGGDIRRVRELVLAGEVAEAAHFFEREFALNLAIAEYPKPIVSLINGFCLGGGCGLALHGQFRVASETARIGMPETAIGYFPDVGASHILSRLADGLGLYLGLTGAMLDARAARASGLVTHLCPAEAFDALVESLAAGQPPEAALARYDDKGGFPDGLDEDVHRYFGGARSMVDIYFRLRTAAQDPFARRMLEILETLSPTSLELAFSLQDQARSMSLKDVLALELTSARSRILHPDFAEGIRARLVDRDQPRWTNVISTYDNIP